MERESGRSPLSTNGAEDSKNLIKQKTDKTVEKPIAIYKAKFDSGINYYLVDIDRLDAADDEDDGDSGDSRDDSDDDTGSDDDDADDEVPVVQLLKHYDVDANDTSKFKHKTEAKTLAKAKALELYGDVSGRSWSNWCTTEECTKVYNIETSGAVGGMRDKPYAATKFGRIRWYVAAPDALASAAVPYTVNHYKLGADGTSRELADTDHETAPANSRVHPPARGYKGFTAPPTRTVTVSGSGTTAIEYEYERETRIVTVTPNGGAWNGSRGSRDLTQAFGADLGLADPVRPGYEFDGWTTERDGSGSTYEQAMSPLNWTTGRIELFAQWTPVVYSISYDLADDGFGWIDGDAPESYTIEDADIELPVPRLPGYEFDGWTVSGASGATGGGPCESIASGTYGNLTLTASWHMVTELPGTGTGW